MVTAVYHNVFNVATSRKMSVPKDVPKEWFMPLFWVLVIAGVIALVLRNAGGHEGEVSRELAALRRDIQDLEDEVRKLREEHKASSSTGG